MKRTMDNRFETNIQPGFEDLYPKEFDFDKYPHFED